LFIDCQLYSADFHNPVSQKVKKTNEDSAKNEMAMENVGAVYSQEEEVYSKEADNDLYSQDVDSWCTHEEHIYSEIL